MFLNLNLSQYPSKDVIKNELQQIKEVYPNLNAKMEEFDIQDGNHKNLITLGGTIKIKYEKNNYNIPISIYLPDLYPLKRPIVFVRPTNEMEIKISGIVDGKGEINIPYLSNWNHLNCNLVSLMTNICQVFSNEPPMYTKIYEIAEKPTTSTKNPLIGFNKTPKAIKEAAENIVYGSHSLSNFPYTMISRNNELQLPVKHENKNLILAKFPGQDLENNRKSIKIDPQLENTQLQSLRKLVEEKYKRYFDRVLSSYKSDLEYLENESQMLNSRAIQLFNLMEEFQIQINEVKKESDTLNQINKSIFYVIDNLEKESNNGITYDRTINTTTPLYKQLLEAFIEEQSIDDAVYFIGEALGKSVIDVENFLKKVRELSRRQFILRATIRLCREKAKLPINN